MLFQARSVDRLNVEVAGRRGTTIPEAPCLGT